MAASAQELRLVSFPYPRNAFRCQAIVYREVDNYLLLITGRRNLSKNLMTEPLLGVSGRAHGNFRQHNSSG